MTFIKFLSALLFACVLASLAYAGFWFVSLKFTEKAFAGLLSSHLGVTASYDGPEWIPDIRQVAVRLPNVSVRIALPEDARLVLTWPEATLRSAYFGGSERMKVELPQQGYAQLVHGGETVATYGILTSGSELLLMPQRVQWQTFMGKISRQMAGEAEAQAVTLYTWKDGGVVWESTGTAPVLKVQAKDIAGVVRAQSFQLEAEVNRLEKLGPVNWALVLQPEKDRLQLWMNRLVQTLQQEGQVNVKRLAIRESGWEVDGRGGVTVGRDGVPRGEVTLQTADGKHLADMLVKAQVAIPSTAEEVMRYAAALEKMREEGGTPLAKLVLHQGVAILNAQRVGRVPSATTIVDGWFK